MSEEQNTNTPNQSTIESFNQIKQGKYTTSSLADFKKSLKSYKFLRYYERISKEIEEGKEELISWEEIKEKYRL